MDILAILPDRLAASLGVCPDGWTRAVRCFGFILGAMALYCVAVHTPASLLLVLCFSSCNVFGLTCLLPISSLDTARTKLERAQRTYVMRPLLGIAASDEGAFRSEVAITKKLSCAMLLGSFSLNLYTLGMSAVGLISADWSASTAVRVVEAWWTFHMIIRLVGMVLRCCRYNQDQWFQIAFAVKGLANFSSMRFLGFLTAKELKAKCLPPERHFKTLIRSPWWFRAFATVVVLFYVFAYAFLGLTAFLSKLSAIDIGGIVQLGFSGMIAEFFETPSMHCHMIHFLAFANQMIGLTDGDHRELERALLLIFGGPDSVYQSHEFNTMQLYMDALFIQIWEQSRSPADACVTMLTFNADDLQRHAVSDTVGYNPPAMSPEHAEHNPLP